MLLSIPTEIRLKIYALVFPAKKCITAMERIVEFREHRFRSSKSDYINTSWPSSTSASLLATCTQVHREAQPLLYQKLELLVHATRGEHNHLYLLIPGEIRLQLISLSLQINPHSVAFYEISISRLESLNKICASISKDLPNVRELHCTIQTKDSIFMLRAMRLTSWLQQLRCIKGLRSLTLSLPLNSRNGVHFPNFSLVSAVQKTLSEVFNELCQQMIDAKLGYQGAKTAKEVQGGGLFFSNQ